MEKTKKQKIEYTILEKKENRFINIFIIFSPSKEKEKEEENENRLINILQVQNLNYLITKMTPVSQR